MQYFSAIKGKKVLIRATAWMHVNTLTERSQIQKNTYYIIPHTTVQKRQNYKEEMDQRLLGFDNNLMNLLFILVVMVFI